MGLIRTDQKDTELKQYKNNIELRTVYGSVFTYYICIEDLGSGALLITGISDN